MIVRNQRIEQDSKKAPMVDLHFTQSFLIGLVAIALFTVVLPLVTPSSKVTPANTNPVTLLR